MCSSIPPGLAAALDRATCRSDRALLLTRAGVTEYAGEDLAGLDNRGLLDDVMAIHTQMETLRAVWLSRIAEIDRRQAATEEEGAVSTAAWLRAACLIPGGTAAAAVRVARRLADLPRVADALRAGRIGFDAAALITRALSRARVDRAVAAGLTGEALAAVQTALVDIAETTDPIALRGELAKVVEHLDAAPTPDDPDGTTSTGTGEGGEGMSELYASKTLDDVVHLTGRFDAVDGAAVLTALDAASAPAGPEDSRTPAQRRAAALVELANHTLAGGQLPANGGERPHVGVLVPIDVLTGTPTHTDPDTNTGTDPATDLATAASAAGQQPAGEQQPGGQPPDRPEVPDGPAAATVRFLNLTPVRPETTTAGRRCAHLNRLADTLHTNNCGRGGIGEGTAWLIRTGPISPEAARLLACDSIVHRIVLGPDSIPLDVGRAARIVPAPLRRALVARDRGCAFPGCDRPPDWCEAHHIDHWADGGPTSLDNCVLLCAAHHKLIHHTGWQVHAVPGGRPYFTRPGGTRYHGPRLPRAG